MNEARRCVACCDLGGTKVLLGLVDEEGQILARDRYLLGALREPGQVVEGLSSRFRALAARAGLTWRTVVGVGCSLAGMLDVESGVVFSAPNVGAWRDVPFVTLLQEVTHRPTLIEMDANAATLGEAWKGVGVGADHFVYVVVGTGIGAGILMNGHICRGWRGTAGELGHTTIDPNGPLCSCGRYGCLEALASGPAIALRAKGAILQGRKSVLQDVGGGNEITAEIIFDAARQGDGVAGEVVCTTVGYLAIGLTNVIHLLNPQVIGLGGGVVLGGADLLMDPLRREVGRRCGSWVDVEGTRIVEGTLGEDAGLLGVAHLVWESIV